MSLRLTNTLSKQKENFKPINPGHVSIYCCGVTVYDLCHLGHARSYIIWDVLRRYLIWEGYKVNFVQNFTDIDDKILAKAKQGNCTMTEISEKNIKEFHYDMDALGILRPDKMPRATRCLDGIRSMIQKLEKEGAAYSIDGNVYFSVMKHARYGQLSRRDLSDQQFNADGRISKEESYKKNSSYDFALWKKAKPGEPSFHSPWGKGRPGWHIECSAMVLQELGETIDIHLGGADLIFPHHENEIAQSEAANGKSLARLWLHNGMVNVSGKKMSKSLGNFTTIRSLLDEGISPMTIRLFVLQAHYRKPLDFTTDSVNAASKGWIRLNDILCLGFRNHKDLNWPKNEIQEKSITSQNNNILPEILKQPRQQFIDALNDDLNTAVALSVLFELARPLKILPPHIKKNSLKELSQTKKQLLYSRWKLLIELASVLGLRAELSQTKDNETKSALNELQINSAIKERLEAKSSKDFAKADEIRNILKNQGIELIDKPNGVTDWIKS